MEVRNIVFQFATTALPIDIAETPTERPLQAAKDLARQSRTNSAPSGRGTAFGRFFKSVADGKPANPSRRDAIQRFEDTYAKDAFGKNETREGLEGLLARSGNVALVANRGLGKTAWVNNWLHERTRTFIEDDLKFNWFRIDVGKLYDARRLALNGNGHIRMSDYFELHSAYVFLEYSGALSNPHARSEHEYSPMLTRLLDAIRRGGNRSEFDDAVAIIQAFYVNLKKTRDLEQRPSENVIEEAISLPADAPARRSFSTVYRFICQVSDQEGMGILAIIDGIDNVSWRPLNEQYSRMCREASSFIYNFHNSSAAGGRKILVVARPETIPEIEVHYPAQVTEPPVAIEFDAIELPAPDPSAVLRRKLSAARESSAYALERYRCFRELDDDDTFAQKSFAEEHSRYLSSVPTFLDTLVAEVRSLLSKVETAERDTVFLRGFDPNNPLILFDSNVRAMLNGFRRSVEGRRVAADVGAAVEGIKTTEYILLGGKLFMDSTPAKRGNARYDEIADGEVFPNIFWYDAVDAVSSGLRWQGLAGLRMLQLAHATSLVGGDLLQVLHDCFGYSPNVLREHLEAFVAYGLIDIQYQGKAAEPQLTRRKEFLPFRSIVRTSVKGRILTTLAMHWVDWQYFLCLDTPVHREFIPQVTRRGRQYIRMYRTPVAPFEFEFHFVEAVIPTVSTFLRHIWHWHTVEWAALQQTMRDAPERFSPLLSDGLVSRTFDLPPLWLDNCARQLEKRWEARRGRPSLDIPERSQVEQFERDFIGTFGQPAG